MLPVTGHDWQPSPKRKKLATFKTFKKLSTLLFYFFSASALTAGEEVQIDPAILPDDSPSPWSFSLGIEPRYRPEATYDGRKQGEVNQIIYQLGFNYEINDKTGIFGSLWLRDRQSDLFGGGRETSNDDWITGIDLMIGAYYSVNQYFSPYVFVLNYWDRERPYDAMGIAGENLTSSFAAVGFSGTAWKYEKHAVTYYAEYYFGVGSDGYGVYEDWFSAAGSEVAVKYSYSFLKNASIYYQPTWYVFGRNAFSKGCLEHRMGIKFSF